MLTIASNPIDTARVVTLAGRIDATNARQLEEQCLAWIDGGDKRLIFDLAQVQYISSAGLRTFLLAARKMSSVEGEIRLAALNQTLSHVFDISGFNRLFAIYPALEAALAP
ncbi:STAS domain-containing protein [Candidatus Woesearchaeota archaeon]|jgi:anti-anti-sigma factor|nr:STAS domain-containing protein [Candidatus Woesearchaeota archaeon]